MYSGSKKREEIARSKFSEEEEDRYVEQLTSKKLRLSEVDCRQIPIDELETLSRNPAYVLPAKYLKLVQEFRAVYKIPSPEEELKELRSESQARRRELQRLRPEKVVGDGINFNFREKYEQRAGKRKPHEEADSKER